MKKSKPVWKKAKDTQQAAVMALKMIEAEEVSARRASSSPCP